MVAGACATGEAIAIGPCPDGGGIPTAKAAGTPEGGGGGESLFIPI